MINIRGIHKIMMSMALQAAKMVPSAYQLYHEYPMPKGEGHAAQIKRQAKKRRNKK
jgi:hypothetical protein